MKKTLLIILSIIIVLLFTSCSQTTEINIVKDLEHSNYEVEKGIDKGDYTYKENLDQFNENYKSKNIEFKNIYSFRDEVTMEIGYIYEIEDKKQLEELYLYKKRQSFFVNDIIFIYKVDKYVLEVYHPINSVFPGFLRQYDFEANYQYYYYYTNTLEFHPLVEYFLEQGAIIESRWNIETLIERKAFFLTLNIPVKQETTIFYSSTETELSFHLTIKESDTVIHAVELYSQLEKYSFPLSSVREGFIQYQNLAINIVSRKNTEETASIIFDGFEYQYYD